MCGGRPDRSPEPRDVASGETGAPVPRSFLERRSQLELDQRLAVETFHRRRFETIVGQHPARLALELLEGPDALSREELLRRREAVYALLRVDDQDPLELVDAIDRADVDAREVFDVDAGLGDDVGHRSRSVYSGRELLDEFLGALCEGGFHDYLVEAGFVSAAQSRGVGVIGETENRNVRIGVRDLVGVDPSDIRNHEIRRVDAVDRDEVITRKKSFELAAKVEVDSRQQDRRHVTRVTLRVTTPQRLWRVLRSPAWRG